MVARRDRNLARSTVLLLALLFLFLTCVLPVCAYNLHTLLSQSPGLHLNIAIYMLYWVQYGVNFCVYAAVNPKFRRAYRELFFGEGLTGSNVENGGGDRGASGRAYKPSVTKLMLATPHLCVATSMTLPVEEEEEEGEDSRIKRVIRDCSLPLLFPLLFRLPKGRRSCRYLRSCSYHGPPSSPLAPSSPKARKASTPVVPSAHTRTYSTALFPHY